MNDLTTTAMSLKPHLGEDDGSLRYALELFHGSRLSMYMIKEINSRATNKPKN